MPIASVVDHGISLGIYFHDPDGNGIEVYYEMLRTQWPRQERIFAADMVGRGLFPGPWDDDVVPRREAAAARGAR